MIRFQPSLCSQIVSHSNVHKVIECLSQYSVYEKPLTSTPIIYLSDTKEIDNVYAIDYFLRDKFVSNDPWEPQYVDFKYYTASMRFAKTDLMSRSLPNRLLTRIWFDRQSKDYPEIRVLMERGNFPYHYIRSINRPHTFENAEFQYAYPLPENSGIGEWTSFCFSNTKK